MHFYNKFISESPLRERAPICLWFRAFVCDFAKHVSEWKSELKSCSVNLALDVICSCPFLNSSSYCSCVNCSSAVRWMSPRRWLCWRRWRWWRAGKTWPWRWSRSIWVRVWWCPSWTTSTPERSTAPVRECVCVCVCVCCVKRLVQ